MSVASVQSTGEVLYTHGDHLGSANLRSRADGSNAGRRSYSPFGNTAATEADGEEPDNRGFTGQIRDLSTGLYFYNARYYDPELGRFTQADTQVQAPQNPQSLNRYSYALNNPLIYTDPTGHSVLKFFKQTAARVGEFFEQSMNKIEHYVRNPKDFLKRKVLRPAAASLVAFSMVVFTAGMGTPAAVAAISAAQTTQVLDTGEGRQAIRSIGEEFYDDILGMRPAAAQAWASVTSFMAVNAGFQMFYAHLWAPNKIGAVADSAGYSDEELAALLEESGGTNYGGTPRLGAGQIPGNTGVLLNEAGESVGLISRGLNFAGPQHNGILMKGLEFERVFGHPPSLGALGDLYGIGSISHQAANQSLLSAGYSTTISGLSGGPWSSYVSSLVYGPYGGGDVSAYWNCATRDY
ncbi:MAG: hypothetical protein JW937_08860 [Candidatus Omnitrophica bacterium]|nr:hypothetical protein [Candidatus Omnitrophota bacterium]